MPTHAQTGSGYLFDYTQSLPIATAPVVTTRHDAVLAKANARPFALNTTVVSMLQKGSRVDIVMPDDSVLRGQVVRKGLTVASANRPGFDAASDAQLPNSETVISLENGAGSVVLTEKAGQPQQIQIWDVRDGLHIYQAPIDDGVSGLLIEEDGNKYVCVDMPRSASHSGRAIASSFQARLEPRIQAGRSKGVVAQAAPSLAELQSLQSRPAATKILLVNYWGGTLSNTRWNETYTSNAPIVYTPFSLDADSANFSAAEIERMWAGWLEAAEDYSPFDVNVTTDVSLYNAASSANRGMLIATTSRSWYPSSAGGVAYINGYGDDTFSAGWVWNDSLSSLGMTISHEGGHMMGLSHDGTASLGYYGGHGIWGPIMGAPFGKDYVQWSKGEYPGANQTQDDIAITGSVLGFAQDEVGDSAAPMVISSNTSLVRRVNSSADEDVFKFTLGQTGPVTLSVQPYITSQGEAYGSNLSLSASLNDSNGMLASAAITGDPSSNVLNYAGSLNAGDYTVQIRSQSPNPDWNSNGFGEYGDLGLYQLQISSTETGADLVAQLALSKTTLISGATLNWTATLDNLGDQNATAAAIPEQVRFMISGDNIIDPADTAHASVDFTGLAASSTSAPITHTSALAIAAGDYWLGVCVEAVAGETVTINNCSPAVPVKVNDSGPNLVTQLNVDDTTLFPGQAFGWTATLQNLGDQSAQAASPPEKVRFLFSTDEQITLADTEHAVTDFSDLAVGVSQDYSDTRPMAALAAGSYWLGVCVDAVVAETDTTNNCSDGVPVTVTDPGLDLDIAAAVESTHSFSRGGDATFFRLADATAVDADSAQAGTIGSSSESYVEATVTGPANISFRWKVSSELNFDYFNFMVNGSVTQRISGEADWATVNIGLVAGTHLLRWSYVKDSYVEDGADTAWLDDVRLIPAFSVQASNTEQNEGDSGNTPFVFDVQLRPTPIGPTSVSFTVSGDGLNPADSADFNGGFGAQIIHFATGETSQLVTINGKGDTNLETDEGFKVVLSAPTNAELDLVSNASSIIKNDEVDTDGDLVSDADDNCPAIYNPGQANYNNLDDDGDACDTDDDNDGLPNAWEQQYSLAYQDASNQLGNPDGDDWHNLAEYGFGTNPIVADPDADGNGIPDSVDEQNDSICMPIRSSQGSIAIICL